LLLTQVSTGGSYFGDIFFGLLIFGPGLGAGTVAASSAALTGVTERESGLASGFNTAAFQIGGAFGVAIVSTVIVSHIASPTMRGMTAGFRAGFTACVIFAVVGLLLALVLLRRSGASSGG
jgi:MFS family permease